MGMFETTGRWEAGTERKENTLRKLVRMKMALSHREPDRVPISDFFWGGYTRSSSMAQYSPSSGGRATPSNPTLTIAPGHREP